MKDLIKELKSALTDDNKSIATILLKAKVLGYEIDSKEFVDWVNLEINGYNEITDDVPSYRTVVAPLWGVMTNGYTRYPHYQIPTAHIEEETREFLITAKIRQGISELELYANNPSNENLISPIPPELLVTINKNIPTNGFHVESAQREIPKSFFRGILSSVRAKLLDFILELDKEYKTVESVKEHSEDISKMLSTTIFGNNNVVITGSNNIQEAKIINKNNLEDLQRVLKNAEISEEDIAEISEIVQNEQPDEEKKEFGPKVKGWIKNMLNKAVDGTLKMSFTTAGQLIHSAISNYYGF